MMTGVIFSGEIDTDILFDYGIFTPRCRWIDLADIQHLQMKIDLRMPHLTGDRLFPDWNGVVTKLGTAVARNDGQQNVILICAAALLMVALVVAFLGRFSKARSVRSLRYQCRDTRHLERA